jgi:hypothetical protein
MAWYLVKDRANLTFTLTMGFMVYVFALYPWLYMRHYAADSALQMSVHKYINVPL